MNNVFLLFYHLYHKDNYCNKELQVDIEAHCNIN